MVVIMKKLAAALLLFALLFAFSGCKLNTLSDAEAQAFLEKNLEEAKLLTDFFYGEGAPLAPGESEKIDPAWTTSHYLPIDPEYRFQTVDEVKKAAERIFTDEFLVPVYDYCFNGTDDFLSRYGESEGRLTRDVTKEPFGRYAAIDAASAKVVEGNRYTCLLSVDATTATGSRVKREIRLSFDPDLGDWKFDSAVW